MSEKTAADKKEASQDQHKDASHENADTDASAVESEMAQTDVDRLADDGRSEIEVALDEAREKAEDNWNQYLRAVAELDNTRKRAGRDVEHARRFAIERFAADLLPVKDSLEMGLNVASDVIDKADALLEGTQMTLKQLAQVFEKFGITEIDPKGERFDPEMHEAMATQPSSDAEPDTVLTVVQKGYMLNGRMLRAARVLVARKPDEE